MKNIKLFATIIFAAALLVMFAGCSVETIYVTDTVLDENNHVIAYYSDGTTKDLGEPAKTEEETAAPVAGRSVDHIETNDDIHAIAYYTDGTTEDLGYVGVEVEPPLYTVTFVDNAGNTLKTEQVYRGRSATAPTAPSVKDMSFAGWNADFSNVQSDMTIAPTYKAFANFTVTFKDANGNVLKTESVVMGHSATAPSAPSVAGKVFSGWSGDFSNVQSDITVTATYRVAGSYVVTFNDYNGVCLGTANAAEGGTATAPVTPTRDGYTFTGWSDSLSNITSNKTVTAKYNLISATNVFDIATKVSGTDLTVTITMKGSVKVCGMEGSVNVPSGLTFVSSTDGSGTTSNYTDGVVYFMFSSSNGQNVTSEFVVTTLKFKINAGAPASVKLATTISDIYDQSYAVMGKKIVGETVKLK